MIRDREGRGLQRSLVVVDTRSNNSLAVVVVRNSSGLHRSLIDQSSSHFLVRFLTFTLWMKMLVGA